MSIQLPATCQCSPGTSLTAPCASVSLQGDLSSDHLAQSEGFPTWTRFLLENPPCRACLWGSATDKPAAAAADSKPRLFCVTRARLAWGFFCSHESQVALQDFAVTDARRRSETRLKLLSIILFLELCYQGGGEANPAPSVILGLPGFVWRDTSLQGPAPPAAVPAVTR